MRTSPTPFKFADVSLILKSDDNMVKGNFRPVCILSILSKLYEGILDDQIIGSITFVKYLTSYYLPIDDITVVRQFSWNLLNT